MRMVLVVSGGIAAYKACELARELGRRGHTVRAVLTEGATRFVTPLGFEALTGEPAFSDLWRPRLGSMEHIDLARWAEAVVCAPATADLMARLACGLGDDLATTMLLAWDGPLLLAPAMNPTMWAHPATRANVATLVARGAVLAGPDRGDTACGEAGEGRMLEPVEIAARLEALVAGAPGAAVSGEAVSGEAASGPPVEDLAGLQVLVSAGPTREFLDPARFLSNPSTGKMGFLVAAAARRRGAHVTLVAGPTALAPPLVDVLMRVTSAADMAAAVREHLGRCDVFVSAAAVADWTPKEAAPEKRKKRAGSWSPELVRTEDILAAAGAARRPGQVLVGFAAETSEVIARGQEKLGRKGVDLLVANRIGAPGTGFGGDDDEAALLVEGRDPPAALQALPKATLAERIWDAVLERMGRAPPDVASPPPR